MSLVAFAPGFVPIAGFMLLPTSPGILWTFAWSWVNYGGALSSGARYGRGPTAQECMDLRVRHNADTSVKLKTLGQYFPPWTVTHAAWNTVLHPGMSAIATDVMLFHQHGGRLVHRYRLYAPL